MQTALVAKPFNLPQPVDSLDAYLQAVNQIPVLSAMEETELAQRLQTTNDLEAARQLIMAHLRFVVHIARSYTGYGLPLGDLIQEGNIGLMKAVKRFDPSHEVRLVSFAVHWIKAEIHEFVLRNWRIVKIATTKAQRKLFFNLRSAKKNLEWLSQEEASAIANDLGVKTDTVFEMEKRLSGQDLSFDPTPDSGYEERDVNTAPAAFLQDDNADPAEHLESENWDARMRDQLSTALEQLDPRSRDVIQRRWLGEKKSTLHELAAEYAISAERIRQIEATALKKLQIQLVA